MKTGLTLLLSLIIALGGCATRDSRTADAVGCSRIGIDILDSPYKKQGSTTTWCARCKDKVYRCVSNAEKTRLECRESVPGDGCV